MTELDDDTRTAMALADRIKPLLAGHGPEVQSAALVELVATWLAGYQGPDQDQCRKDMFGTFAMGVRAMLEVHDAELEAELRDPHSNN